MTIYRHGDLIFQKVDGVVDGDEIDRLVIAEGEATGHAHVLIADVGSKIKGDRTKFTLTGKAKLVHQEHDTIEFLPGTYVVLNEREHDYVEETIKKVKD